MTARPADWQAELAGAPPRTLLPLIAASGFDGVYVDRAGYPDGARALETELGRTAAAQPIASPDGRFALFDIRGYRRALEQRMSGDALRALADGTLNPLRTDWSASFTDRHAEGTELVRWTTVPDASVTVTNPSDDERSATLFVRVSRSGGEPAPVVISYPDGTSQPLQVGPEGLDLKRSLAFPPGESTIGIRTDAPAIAAPRGVTTGYVKLSGWRLTPG
jgi:phosphoglycerol transferase